MQLDREPRHWHWRFLSMDDIPAAEQEPRSHRTQYPDLGCAFPRAFIQKSILENFACCGFVRATRNKYLKSGDDLQKNHCSLVNILKRGSSKPQVLYEIVFAIWLLTFDTGIATNLNRYILQLEFLPRYLLRHLFFCRKYDVIPTLVEIAKTAVKEKVIRVVVATFKVRLWATVVNAKLAK